MLSESAGLDAVEKSSKGELRSLIDGVVRFPLTRHHDERGWLCELFRQDELLQYEIGLNHRPVMGYISWTKPGIVRGPHEHRSQTDLFCFVGPGEFAVYLWDNRPGSATYKRRLAYLLGEQEPGALLIPPGVAHGYQNLSDVPGVVLNYPDRLYKGVGRREEVDEIRYENIADSPFVVPDGHT